MSSSPRTPPLPASPDLPPLPPRPNLTPIEYSTEEDTGDRPHEINDPTDEHNNENIESSDQLLQPTDHNESNFDVSEPSDERLDSSDRLLERSDKSTKRPVSYPCGPDTKPETHTVEFKLSSSHSEPLKPPLTRGKSLVKPFTRESLERLEKRLYNWFAHTGSHHERNQVWKMVQGCPRSTSLFHQIFMEDP
ncbi:hypothetical protein HHI36_003105 [Cryptolaemus montrouzieri]|uniref:Uncharacterized protein n=1 Tax=Cryptolaemus montrouzieri TaxID=559131 RepID=A0ABD2PDA8_9CUCU